LRASGKGSADLNDETVDYLVIAKLVGTVEGQKGDAADELAGLEIPVRIEGPFTAPGIDVQLDEVLKAKLDAKKDELKSKLGLDEDKAKADAEAEKKKLKADVDREKKELEKKIKKEKKKLKKAKQRELEKQLEAEKAKAEKEAKEKLLKDLAD